MSCRRLLVVLSLLLAILSAGLAPRVVAQQSAVLEASASELQRADETSLPWLGPMREVHSRFTGQPGTLAHFGDSITFSLAYWAPLAYEPKGLSPALAADLRQVKQHLRPECWSEWRGPEFGNQGQMTIRWADENLDGWLKKLNPEVAVILFGSNDLMELDQAEYQRRLRDVVARCLANGTVVILTTIPPRHGMVDKSLEFANVVRQAARDLKLPLVDYHAEILRRRPLDWDGALDQFKASPGDEYNVPTLIARDGVHPSNPSDFPQFTQHDLDRNGYSLRTALTLQAYAAVIRHVLQPASAQSTTAVESGAVQMQKESVVIPTYQVGAPDPVPMFYNHESYQGAQKRIYPYALQDHLTHQRVDRTYTSLRLENEFVRLTVLPELGGRLFSATDKTNNYDFFYRQHVIKPALIGMLGAWISGGVEWCAFHHHRNTTFMPVDYTLQEHPDGSKTLWFGETERRHRMRWLIGLTLYPDRSYVEATVKFFNRTPQPNSILYWANVAVHVNDDYQVVFPPSVQLATYHSKIDFTQWPIAQGKYRDHNYEQQDISWWKNSPVSNSFFAWNLQEDFMGGYDHGRRAGVVHVGNHHVVCGAKLWEWGTGAFGRAWDRILTDEDGPYAELMVGAFSDNQPDYSWIGPYEVKTFTQYWYPLREIGPFQKANLHGAVSLTLQPAGTAKLGFHTTSRHAGGRAVLKAGPQVVLEQTIDIGPDQPFTCQVSLPDGTQYTDLLATLFSAEGDELISYQPVNQPPVTKLPDPVQAPPKPEDIPTSEELYLTGLRVEQIHNPSVDPLPYYQEAVRRDAGDARANTMLGIHYNKHGQFNLAEQHLRRAVARLSQGYTRPRDAEANYQLGLALRAQHRTAEAYDSFYRATWDQAFHSAAYDQLAELSCVHADFDAALEQIDRSLSTNGQSTKALNVKSAVLRRLGRPEAAELVAADVLAIDPLDFWAMNERLLVQAMRGYETAAQQSQQHLDQAMRGEVQSYLELASDYMNLGMWQEAKDVLQRPVDAELSVVSGYPLVHYFLGYLRQQLGDHDGAQACFARAASLPSDYCFPFRFEEIEVLEAALAANPRDSMAEYYLGNLLFDHQPEKAMEHWDRSRSIDPTRAMAHRNQGWAYYRVKNDVDQAIACYELAASCRQLEPRMLLELDQLYEAANAPPERRLAALEKHHEVVVKRQESFVREITVLVLAGKYPQALEYLEKNLFHAQEGREDIHDVYVDAHLLQGLARMDQRQPLRALEHFRRAAEYPDNLSVGRPANDPRGPQVAYYQGAAYEALGDTARARQCYQQAADQADTKDWPEARCYQARSLTKLDRAAEAQQIYEQLIETGNARLAQEGSVDFFAKFGQQENRRTRSATAHYLLGLGFLGRAESDKAREHLSQAVQQNLSHTWARYELQAMGAAAE